jgi:hypothetical protein
MSSKIRVTDTGYGDQMLMNRTVSADLQAKSWGSWYFAGSSETRHAKWTDRVALLQNLHSTADYQTLIWESM